MNHAERRPVHPFRCIRRRQTMASDPNVRAESDCKMSEKA